MATEQPIGRETAEVILTALVEQKMLDAEGRIQPAFDPKRADFKLELPEASSGAGAGRGGPAGGLPDRAAHPAGAGTKAQPAQEGGHAQPRVPGPLGPHQAQDHLSGGVRDR